MWKKALILSLSLLLSFIAEGLAQEASSPSVEAIYAYYDAINRQDCKAATRIRPEYTKEKCRAIEKVIQRGASSIQQISNHDILFLDVKYKQRNHEDIKVFDGFVTMKKHGKRWVILSSSLRSKDKMSVDAYIKLVKQEYTIRSDLDSKSESPVQPEEVVKEFDTKQLSPKKSDPMAEDARAIEAARNKKNRQLALLKKPKNKRPSKFRKAHHADMWQARGPRTFGSRKIIKECWPNSKDLRGKRSEKRTRRTGPGAYMKRPPRARPKRQLARLPNRYRRSIRRIDTNGKKLVALTFDTGERNNDYAGYDAQIVDYLRANSIKATFYFGGKWMATHPERAAQLVADPLFEPGNHAWTHGNMRVLKGRAMRDQILFTQAQYELVLEDLEQRECVQRAGEHEFFRIPQQLPTFRYPYGTCSNASLKAVNDVGLPAVQWDVVSADPARGQTANAIVRGVLRAVKPGSVVVMHANGRGWNTGKALPKLIPALRKRGYKFVTVSELLRAGKPIAKSTCYELKPGDNMRYDRLFGKGTGD